MCLQYDMIEVTDNISDMKLLILRQHKLQISAVINNTWTSMQWTNMTVVLCGHVDINAVDGRTGGRSVRYCLHRRELLKDELYDCAFSAHQFSSFLCVCVCVS